MRTEEEWTSCEIKDIPSAIANTRVHSQRFECPIFAVKRMLDKRVDNDRNAEEKSNNASAFAYSYFTGVRTRELLRQLSLKWA